MLLNKNKNKIHNMPKIDTSFIVSVVILTLLAVLAVVFIALYFSKPFHVYASYTPDQVYTITDSWDLTNNSIFSYTIYNRNPQVRSIGFTMPNATNFSGLNDVSILYSASNTPYDSPIAVYAVNSDGQLDAKNGLEVFDINGITTLYNLNYHTGRNTSTNYPFLQLQTFTFLFSNSIAFQSLTFLTNFAF
jgi:hypothetical protein